MSFRERNTLCPALVLFLEVGLCLLQGTPSLGQQLALRNESSRLAPSPMLNDSTSWVIRREVNEVTVMFTANLKDHFVADLQPQEVQVRDDNKPPAAITDFRNEQNLPLRLGLLIDTSGSVYTQFDFERQAASQFVREILDQPHDRAFVAGFSHQMRLVQDFTNRPAELDNALKRLYDDAGDTALFDSIAEACKLLTKSGDQGRVARVLVVFSDGNDNGSRRKLRDAKEIAQSSEVTIYTVTADPWLSKEHALNVLTKETGGRSWFPDSAEQLAKAFARIRDELRYRYAVSYRPAEFKPDGHFRPIRIVARRGEKKLHVRARKGYYARPVADVK